MSKKHYKQRGRLVTRWGTGTLAYRGTPIRSHYALWKSISANVSNNWDQSGISFQVSKDATDYWALMFMRTLEARKMAEDGPTTIARTRYNKLLMATGGRDSCIQSQDLCIKSLRQWERASHWIRWIIPLFHPRGNLMLRPSSHMVDGQLSPGISRNPTSWHTYGGNTSKQVNEQALYVQGTDRGLPGEAPILLYVEIQISKEPMSSTNTPLSRWATGRGVSTSTAYYEGRIYPWN